MRFAPTNSEFAADVKESFAAQVIMQTIGAQLVRIDPGVVEILLPYRKDLTQQDGYLHAGTLPRLRIRQPDTQRLV